MRNETVLSIIIILALAAGIYYVYTTDTDSGYYSDEEHIPHTFLAPTPASSIEQAIKEANDHQPGCTLQQTDDATDNDILQQIDTLKPEPLTTEAPSGIPMSDLAPSQYSPADHSDVLIHPETLVTTKDGLVSMDKPAPFKPVETIATGLPPAPLNDLHAPVDPSIEFSQPVGVFNDNI